MSSDRRRTCCNFRSSLETRQRPRCSHPDSSTPPIHHTTPPTPQPARRGFARTNHPSPAPCARPPQTTACSARDIYGKCPHQPIRVEATLDEESSQRRLEQIAQHLRVTTYIHTHLRRLAQHLQRVTDVRVRERLVHLLLTHTLHLHLVQAELLEGSARAVACVLVREHDVVVTDPTVTIHVILHRHLVPVRVVLVGQGPTGLYVKESGHGDIDHRFFVAVVCRR